MRSLETIYALCMRELLRFSRERSSLYASLARPVLWLIVLGSGMHNAFRGQTGVPYAAYLAGDAVKASGVIAVVTAGLFVSRQSSTFFSPGVRLQALAVWDALEFLLNGLVFVLIGLQLPYVLTGIQGDSRWNLFRYGLVFSVVLVLLRMIWMYPASRVSWSSMPLSSPMVRGAISPSR